MYLLHLGFNNDISLNYCYNIFVWKEEENHSKAINPQLKSK